MVLVEQTQTLCNAVCGEGRIPWTSRVLQFMQSTQTYLPGSQANVKLRSLKLITESLQPP